MKKDVWELVPGAVEYKNEHHVSDINYSRRYTRWFLRIIGVWSLIASQPSKIEKIVSSFILPFTSVVMTILIVPETSCMITRRVKGTEILVLCGPLAFHISNIMKHYGMIFQSDAIKLSMSHMDMDWRMLESAGDRDIMLKHVRIGHNVTIICTVCMYSGNAFYHAIKPACVGKIVNEFNETVRPLAYPCTDLFLDSQANGVYEFVFFSIFFAGFLHFTVGTALCNLAVILVSHACGQIQIIVSKLESLADSTDDSAVIENRMGFIVRSHVRLLKFAMIIEKALKAMCLMEVVAATLVICFLEYYCITEWSNSDGVAMFTYIVLLTSFVFNLFIYCQVGEVLKEQCQAVGKTAYMIEWYKLPSRARRALILIITVGHYPTKLTAGGMMDLSKVSFASIMKTSFAYLNILRRAA